jgi:hypothetical protein
MKRRLRAYGYSDKDSLTSRRSRRTKSWRQPNA